MREDRGAALQVTRQSTLQFVSRLCQTIEPAPDGTIDGHHDRSHYDCGCNKKIEIARICCPADDRTQPHRRKYLPVGMKIFGNNAGVPGTAGRGDQPRYQVRKNARKDEFAPLRGRAELENRSSFLDISGDSNRASYDVKKNVRLCSKQQQTQNGRS
jgi:hypothetical protein